MLEARGIVIRGVQRAGPAPTGAALLTSADSAPLAELLEAMLKPSDDWIAEMLTKSLAPAPGSTAAGAAIVRRAAARLGARATLVDGSGLDARDRGTATGLVSLLRRMRDDDAFFSALAQPGRAGTLRDRLTTGRARRNCRGKTGTPSVGRRQRAGRLLRGAQRAHVRVRGDGAGRRGEPCAARTGPRGAGARGRALSGGAGNAPRVERRRRRASSGARRAPPRLDRGARV